MWGRWKWGVAGAAVGLVILFFLLRLPDEPRMVTDLVEAFPSAQARPNAEAFILTDVTIAGQTLKSIYVTQASRITWNEKVPEHAWLDVSLGVREEAWTRPGDGVLFMVGVSHAGTYDELVSLIVNPYANPADRQWYPLLLDLSPYAGQDVEIIFNTRPGVEGATPDNDLAVWGAPALVTR